MYALSMFQSVFNVRFVCLFVRFCSFTSQVNSYGHGGTVSLPDHTFSWASLDKRLTRGEFNDVSTLRRLLYWIDTRTTRVRTVELALYFVHILSLVTDNNHS